MKIIVYPRLYQSTVPGENGVINSRGDQTIDDIFRSYDAGVVAVNNNELRFRTLDAALRLFGNFRDWMLLQRNNPNLIGYNAEFIKDTMRYIAKGERAMSPIVWLSLVSEKSTHASHPNHLAQEDMGFPPEVDTAKLLQLWCGRPDGFQDLLQSLFVFFGTTLIKEQKE